jgi:hypothetical protein
MSNLLCSRNSTSHRVQPNENLDTSRGVKLSGQPCLPPVSGTVWIGFSICPC